MTNNLVKFPGPMEVCLTRDEGAAISKKTSQRYMCVMIGDVEGQAEATFRGIDTPAGMQPRFILQLHIPIECINVDELQGRVAWIEVINGRATGSVLQWEKARG